MIDLILSSSEDHLYKVELLEHTLKNMGKKP